jgi:hypothetical protein
MTRKDAFTPAAEPRAACGGSENQRPSFSRELRGSTSDQCHAARFFIVEKLFVIVEKLSVIVEELSVIVEKPSVIVEKLFVIVEKLFVIVEKPSVIDAARFFHDQKPRRRCPRLAAAAEDTRLGTREAKRSAGYCGPHKTPPWHRAKKRPPEVNQWDPSSLTKNRAMRPNLQGIILIEWPSEVSARLC